MANPYTPPTLTAYNANPPTDDGTTADQNKASWVKHTGKLTDPLRDYANAINTETESAFAAVVFPPGAVVDYAGETAPTGWVMCDGTSYNSSTDATFVDLFGVLGIKYGGTGAADFNVPDYRGKFRRTVDAGAGNDPDAAGRTDRGDGTTGDAVGTEQSWALKRHIHGNTSSSGGSVSSGSGIDAFNAKGGNTTDVQAGSGDTEVQAINLSANELRPINIYANAIIKK